MALSGKPSVSRVACILKLVVGAGIGSVGSSFPLMVFIADTALNPPRSTASPPAPRPALSANVDVLFRICSHVQGCRFHPQAAVRVGYCRVSTVKTEQDISIDGQRQQLEEAGCVLY